MDKMSVAAVKEFLRCPSILTALALVTCYRPLPLDEASILSELRSSKPLTPSPLSLGPDEVSEETAVITAMEQHPDAVVARASIPVAKGEAKKAAAWRNPQLRVGNENAVEQDIHDQFTVALRWYLPNPFQHVARVEAAEALLPVAEATSDEVAWNVRRDARIAFTRAVYAAKKAELMAERASVREKIRDATRSAVEKGLQDPSDAYRAELRWLQGLADKNAAITEERNAHIELARVMGLADPNVLRIRDPGPGFTCPKPTVDETSLEEHVLPSHPEVRRARAAYNQAEAELKLEHARWIPWFDYFQVGYEYDKPQGRSSVHFGFALDLPFLDWNKGGIALAEAKRDRERLRFREALAESLMQIRRGLTMWREAYEAVERTTAMLLPVAESAVKASQQAMDMGRKDEVFVFEAMEREIEARIMSLDAILACRIAAIQVEHASGVQLISFL